MRPSTLAGLRISKSRRSGAGRDPVPSGRKGRVSTVARVSEAHPGDASACPIAPHAVIPGCGLLPWPCYAFPTPFVPVLAGTDCLQGGTGASGAKHRSRVSEAHPGQGIRVRSRELGHGVIPGCGLRPYPGYAVCLRRGEKARTSVMTSHHLATNRLPKHPAAGTLSACVTVARVSEAHPGHTHACQITRGLVTASSPDAAFGLIRATRCVCAAVRRRGRVSQTHTA